MPCRWRGVVARSKCRVLGVVSVPLLAVSERGSFAASAVPVVAVTVTVIFPAPAGRMSAAVLPRQRCHPWRCGQSACGGRAVPSLAVSERGSFAVRGAVPAGVCLRRSVRRSVRRPGRVPCGVPCGVPDAAFGRSERGSSAAVVPRHPWRSRCTVVHPCGDGVPSFPAAVAAFRPSDGDGVPSFPRRARRSVLQTVASRPSRR